MGLAYKDGESNLLLGLTMWGSKEQVNYGWLRRTYFLIN